MGNYHPKGSEKLKSGAIDYVIETLQKSKLFIGIGSGLSWLSWATGTKTCIISGFSYEYTEPCGENIIRIKTPEGNCTGCFNDHKLDPSDWHWCPVNKNTDNHYICSKSITPEMVIEQIKQYL
jgi:autotransporter strand-loop-strand O-heptosyltransferase